MMTYSKKPFTCRAKYEPTRAWQVNAETHPGKEWGYWDIHAKTGLPAFRTRIADDTCAWAYIGDIIVASRYSEMHRCLLTKVLTESAFAEEYEEDSGF